MTAGSGARAVQRFRSIEEMSAAPRPVGADDAFDRFLRQCARYRALAPRRYPRGVFKYRSIEEAEQARRRTPGWRWPAVQRTTPS